MSKVDAPRHDAVPIGEVAQAPFAVLPDPLKIFAERTQRLRALAQQSELAPYLTFLAALTEAQYRIQDDLPEPDRPPPATPAAARATSPCRRSTATALRRTRRSTRRSSGCCRWPRHSTCRRPRATR